jgi:predicted Zn-dependent peptidase
MNRNPSRGRILLLYLILALIISGTALVAESPAGFKLPEIEAKVLLNGMQFQFFEGQGDRVPFLLMTKNGAAFDPKDKWGATYLMARMMMANLEDEQTRREFEAAEIEIDFRVDWDALYFEGSAPGEEIEFCLTRLSEVFIRPRFEEEDFAQLRAGLLGELEEKAQGMERRTHELFQAEVLRDNPYSHPVEGVPRTVRNLYLRDVKIQYRRLLLPNQTRIALFFSGDRDRLFQRLSRRWGTWVQDVAAPFTFRQSSLTSEPRIRIISGTEEEDGIMRWGFLGVSKSSRDFYALKVFEQYLTLSLPDWAREISSTDQIRGHAKLVARRMPGYLKVSVKAPPQELLAYYRKLLATLNSLQSGDLDLQRFSESKSLVYQEFVTSLSDPLRVAQAIFEAELCELGINYLTTFNLRLERVTPERFQRTLKASLPASGYVLVVAGSAAELSSLLEVAGDVETLN